MVEVQRTHFGFFVNLKMSTVAILALPPYPAEATLAEAAAADITKAKLLGEELQRYILKANPTDDFTPVMLDWQMPELSPILQAIVVLTVRAQAQKTREDVLAQLVNIAASLQACLV